MALLAVYIFWGSTYLAIRIGVQHIPPFALGAIRYLIAGAMLYAVTFRQSRGATDWRCWRAALVIGFLLLIGGNGGVIVGELTVPSGVASLLVALVPFWLVLFDALKQRQLVGPWVVAGLAIGFAGIVLLVKPSPGHVVDPKGAAVIVVGGVMWALGSIYSRGAQQAEPALASVAM
ncbi:MAG: EamA family transporter, partial [Chloroflexota bacterium]